MPQKLVDAIIFFAILLVMAGVLANALRGHVFF
jgi:hypothetical protein